MDVAIGNLYEALYLSEKSRNSDRLIHSVLETNEDILIFGSSRASHHYIPKIIEDSLSMSCFNVGFDGKNIFFHLLLLKETIKRYRPKIIILDLILKDFVSTNKYSDIDQMNTFTPFYNYADSITAYFLKNMKYARYKNISFLYKYNSKIHFVFANNMNLARMHQNGFVPLSRTWKGEIKRADTGQLKAVTNFDSEKIKAIECFISTCIENGTELYVSFSPTFVLYPDENEYHILGEYLYNNYRVNIFNYHNNSTYINNPDLFADPSHLNSSGAKVFTLQLITDIKAHSINNNDR